MTKQFTAASILLLEDWGKLSVSDPVKKYIVDAPAAWDKITIFNLLAHTSGLPDIRAFPEYPKLKLFSTTAEKTVALIMQKPLDFEPGAKFRYSSSGYILLGYLIEKITGESYEKFLQENIFAPLGMKDSGSDSNSAIILRRASGYSPGTSGPVNAGFIHMTIPFAAGDLYSTTEDLLRWEQGLFGGKVISPASLRKMTTPFKSDYAFGVWVHTANGRKIIDHNGGIEGFNTTLAYYPDDKLTVVALANLAGPAVVDIAAKLGALALGEKVELLSERNEISVSPETLARYVGTYEMAPKVYMQILSAYPGTDQLRPGFYLVITLEDGRLLAQATGQRKLPLFAEGETKFFLKAVDAQIEFFKDAKGAVTHLVLHQRGAEMKGERQ